MHRRHTWIAAILFLMGTLAVGSSALGGVGGEDRVVILLNARNPTTAMSAAEAKAVYLGNKAFWHGVVPMKVYQRPAGSKVSEPFLSQIMGMSAQRFASHWSSRELSGKGVSPEVVDTAATLATKIRATPGAVGYLLASEAWELDPQGLRIIELE